MFNKVCKGVLVIV